MNVTYCKCGWRVMSAHARTAKCSQCGSSLVCDGVEREPPVKPKPSAEWPLWARELEKRKQDGEIGVGDTFQRLAKGVGGEVLKKTLKTLGIPCNCDARRDQWNELYPYSARPARTENA